MAPHPYNQLAAQGRGAVVCHVAGTVVRWLVGFGWRLRLVYTALTVCSLNYSARAAAGPTGQFAMDHQGRLWDLRPGGVEMLPPAAAPQRLTPDGALWFGTRKNMLFSLNDSAYNVRFVALNHQDGLRGVAAQATAAPVRSCTHVARSG